MTAQDLREEIDRRLEKHTNIILKELKEIKSMLDELEPKEEWTDIEKSLECLRVEMLNLPTDFDKTVADDHLESLRYIFITQFKENNK